MIPSHLYLASFPTGSNYICDPPVEDTDIDYMYYVKSIDRNHADMVQDGWEYKHVDGYPMETWASYRKGKYNAIVTENLKHFNLFLAATEEAKRLNLLDKKDRIALFDSYLGKKKQTKLDTDDFNATINDMIQQMQQEIAARGTNATPN